MKIAYLIITHNNPLLLKRVIHTLSNQDCTFFIHVDKKSDIHQFSGLEADNIFVCERRIPVFWGEFSQVEATLLLLNEAMKHPTGYSYFILISGSDYPLRSGDYILGFLNRNSGMEFINIKKMPAPGFPISKLTKLRYASDQPVRRFVSRTLGKLGMARRGYQTALIDMEPYCGNTWWALSRDAVAYILEFTESHPAFVNYFRHAFTSDEMFFHTILGNSLFAERFRRSLVYLDWPLNTNHPAVLSERHVRLFEKQEKVWIDDEWGSGEALFARKFSDENLSVIDQIDAMIGRVDSNVGNLPSA